MPVPDVPASEVEDVFDVRCSGGALHFKVIDGNRIEVKCNHWRCTGGDSVVLHRYSFPECELLETLKFKDPVIRGRGAPAAERKYHK